MILSTEEPPSVLMYVWPDTTLQRLNSFLLLLGHKEESYEEV